MEVKVDLQISSKDMVVYVAVTMAAVPLGWRLECSVNEQLHELCQETPSASTPSVRRGDMGAIFTTRRHTSYNLTHTHSHIFFLSLSLSH